MHSVMVHAIETRELRVEEEQRMERNENPPGCSSGYRRFSLQNLGSGNDVIKPIILYCTAYYKADAKLSESMQRR